MERKDTTPEFARIRARYHQGTLKGSRVQSRKKSSRAHEDAQYDILPFTTTTGIRSTKKLSMAQVIGHRNQAQNSLRAQPKTRISKIDSFTGRTCTEMM